ncbi:ABC transporter [Methylorubrum sp. SB2]|uniref:ABC transporter permease n=1 Tax=Methylorubrum subtropicum TaxID=3138812 RepID=UPI00313AEA92
MSAPTRAAVPVNTNWVQPPAHRVTAPPSQVDSYLGVINALMLRDMRSRFSASYWGYLVQMLWPVAHVLVIVSIMAFRDMESPMGDSPLLFVASGAFPFLAFKYISREMMKGYNAHKALLWFPQVKRVDTMVARGAVEICSSFMGLGVVSFVLICLGVDPVPVDIMTAMTGYLTAILMGLAIGSFNVSLVAIFPFWMLMYIVIAIALYMTSGVQFMGCYLPERLYAIMKWNPLVHIVEWVRLGYEPNLPVTIDYVYIYCWIFSAFTVGFLMDRYIVNR